MAIVHHPAQQTLLRYAAGTLGGGPSLVIATHLHFCPACRLEASGYAAACGEMLRTEEPEALSEDALASVLARLDAKQSAPPRPPLHPDLPGPLAHQPVAPWRWLAPGIRMARIGPREKDRSVYLLRCAAGSRLLPHRHGIAEYSCVIKGSYHDSTGHYGVGDTEEAEASLSHAPAVDPDGECIALIAVEGKLQLEGWLARLLQPLFGI